MANLSFDQVVVQVEELKATCLRIDEFKFDPIVTDGWKKAADLFAANREQEAVRAGVKTVEVLRGFLAGYIRGSVFKKHAEEPGYFVNVVDEIERCGYDDDIVDGLREKLEELKGAVKAETNGSFDQRITAYVGLDAAIKAADKEQERRESVYLHGDWNVSLRPNTRPAAVARQEGLKKKKMQIEKARSIF